MHNSAWSALGNNNRQEAEDSHISLTDRGFYNKSEKFSPGIPRIIVLVSSYMLWWSFSQPWISF